MIRVENLSVRMGNLTLIRNVSMIGEDGKVVALVGPNGAGKTTTLKAIMGLYKHAGKIILDGEDISRLPPHLRAKKGIGISPDDGGLFSSLTVYENLMLPIKSLKLNISKLEEVINTIPFIKELFGRKAYTLSGGQRKFVSLARALITGERVVLLDEIFEGIAPKIADEIKRIIKDVVNNKKTTVILAESTTVYIEGLYDNIYFIDRGEIIKK